MGFGLNKLYPLYLQVSFVAAAASFKKDNFNKLFIEPPSPDIFSDVIHAM